MMPMPKLQPLNTLTEFPAGTIDENILMFVEDNVVRGLVEEGEVLQGRVLCMTPKTKP